MVVNEAPAGSFFFPREPLGFFSCFLDDYLMKQRKNVFFSFFDGGTYISTISLPRETTVLRFGTSPGRQLAGEIPRARSLGSRFVVAHHKSVRGWKKSAPTNKQPWKSNHIPFKAF